MARARNTNARGGPFTPQEVEAVWRKATPIKDWADKVWRHDPCGRPIKRDLHGSTSSKNGWEVDHIKPVAKGGDDNLGNLQALQWELNRDKGDTYPWRCP